VEDRELPEMRVTGVLEGTLATMMGQTAVNNLLAPTATVSSEAIQERASTSVTRSVPRFSLVLDRLAA
jgi:hypothetical protein